MKDRIALVTGSSRGVGAATAELLASRGWRVHGLSRSQAGSQAPSRPRAAAGEVHHHRVDLADLADLERRFDGHFAEQLGLASADQVALINNAGVLAMAPTEALDLGDLDRAMRVNVTAPTWLMGWFVAHTPKTTRLDLVNLSSGAASTAYPGWVAYCTGKAALRMAGRGVAADVEEQPALMGRPIHVLDYAPGVVATDMQREIRAADPRHFPRSERFHALYDDDALVPATEPATEIADLLERAEPLRYEERRLGR